MMDSNSTSDRSSSTSPGPGANATSSNDSVAVLPRYLLFQSAKDLRGKKRPDNAWNAEQFRRNR